MRAALLTSTASHPCPVCAAIGNYVFRIYVCQHRADTFDGLVSSFADVAAGTVVRCQCYPRSVEAKLGQDIPLHVDLRMVCCRSNSPHAPVSRLTPYRLAWQSGFSEVAHTICVPAAICNGTHGVESNEPWRRRTTQESGGKNVVGADIEGLAAEKEVCYLHGFSPSENLYRAQATERSKKNADRISRAR